ncbi:peptidoglycan-associated lipoprotein Pal [Maritimibacter sp. 55A14]|uniref:peptidoglycan-associated lipoprotein Pal n=1 Tax=Maritimibacter sp. 55A14 TaxID=2174844 RepID=UPI000D61CAB1|nr:peptidoglycan-associated lipoprotein Pal [Maritimibacter sp. 55A14]PWE29424.1 peptidoglycan-associated lipoprotein Pal [Maritimibacter sp. 55A14]
MKALTSSLLLAATLGLAACGGGFGADGGYGDTPGASTGAGAGGVYDPASPQYFNQTIGDRVHFAVDESTLTQEARTTLDGQANWLMQNAEFTAIIEGHADEQGTREYNLALGARRASAVRDYLVSRGVADSRLRTVSYGKERPIEICSTEACYSKNRRAVTVLSSGASS